MVTTLAMEEPEMTPVMAEETTAAFAGPPRRWPEQGEGDLDEVVAGAGALEQRTEKHEQKDKIGRDAERDTEDAFAGEPEVRHCTGSVAPL